MAALRSLENAEKAYEHADPQDGRPAWASFYDRAELDGLSALVMSDLGRHDEAEAHLHRALSRLRPDYRRNRIYYSVHLALAQLAQGEAEQAVATALPLLPGPGEEPLGGRTSDLLRQFDRMLKQVAPGTRSAVKWADCYAERKKEL
ncbi:tetratricopeptide repeat protein [Streptomyces sp. 2323.1]|uniref:tetratricopeptide repeat protein n=1 Tax=Streptomyces sp. 2323.1 TaxID=1938841 RepID=UPI00133170B5|nr:tetratricopeptide repeat protein [Streptomyces sp. 2323.1]